MILMYGTPDAVQYVDKCKIYNFNSLLDGYEPLYLTPPREVGIYGMNGTMGYTGYNEYQFDVNYMNYIIGNDGPFMQLMRIIMELYEGHNVFLIVSPDDWSTALIESLMKLIQQRYGIQLGIIGFNITSYDPGCVIIWLNMIYRTLYNREKIFDYLRFYPDNAIIPEDIMLDLISQLHVYGETVQDRAKEVKRYSSILKVLPNVRPAIVSTMDSDQVAYNNNVNQLSTTFYG